MDIETTLTSENKRKLLEKLRRGEVARPTASKAVLSRRPSDRPVPLSFQQLQVWLHSQSVPEIPYYNETLVVTRHGPLDVPILERSILEIVRRHEIWRTRFDAFGNEPVQIVEAPPTTYTMPVADLRDLSETEMNSQASQLAALDAALPFDLSQAPLFRARLVRFRDHEFRLYFTFHHIVFDGATANHVLLPELVALYDAFTAGKPSPLPEPPFQYGDFAYWQRRIHSPQSWAADVEFWRKQLSGDLAALGIATDRPRPAVETHRGECERINFSADLVRPLRAMCLSQGATLYTALLASFCALIQRYTGAEEVVVGSMSSGRKLPQLELILGCFVNPMPLRIDLSGNPTFPQLVSRVTRTLLDALDHGDVPFYQVQREISRSADSSRHSFYQIIFSQQPPFLCNHPGWDATPGDMANGGSKLDLHVMLDNRDDEVFGPFVYNPDLYDRKSIQRLVHHWKELLRSIAHAPEAPIGELTILSDEDLQLVLHQSNDTRTSYPKDACLHELIEKQAERSPETTALVFEGENLSYRELNIRANKLAHHLRALGVGADSLVGVCMERSVEMVVALLGVLKAGGAYVPLDPEYPTDRLFMMIEDSQPTVLLTQQHLIERLPVKRVCVVSLDSEWQRIARGNGSNPVRTIKPENLSYAIYTSGSTGRPKGVLNTHAGIVNRLLWMQDAYRLTSSDRVVQKTPYSFDVSVWEFFWPLMTGAGLVVAKPGGHKDPDYLVDLISREQITTIHFVPSMLRAFLEVKGIEDCASLKRVFCSGEALPFDVQERFFSRSKAELHNLYGPTEAAVDVTSWQCQRNSKDSVVPIGRPIANVCVYLLDRNLQPVPVGVPGELHIGGVALARGYLNRPELTAAKFIPDPISKKPLARLYKTGDLARYRADGSIEYVGRIDDQVKIRGFRIELGEIELVLRDHPAVRDARVIVREYAPGDRRLVAYVVFAGQEAASSADILTFAKRKLPSYMVPDLVKLDQLPLTSSGKLDRRALPAPEKGRSLDEAPSPEPKDDIEKLLAKLWSDILKVEHVSLYDNFFDLGGHSLSAIQVVARLQSQLGVRIKVNEVAFQTLGQLAAVCRERLQRA